jgi:holo-[acyl-carrier protein] synthase
MISGIGVDIVQIPRVEGIVEQYQDAFARRILVASELDQLALLDAAEKISFLAKRFAAKEAILKALGCGISKICSFQDIEISNLETGAPIAKIKNSKQQVLLSISDDYPSAIAFAIVI